MFPRTIEVHLRVDRPVSEVWRAWRRFERSSRLLDRIHGPGPLGRMRSRARTGPAGRKPEVTELVPGERIAWESREEVRRSGEIRFIPRRAGRGDGTEIRVRIEVRGDGAAEDPGLEGRLRRELERFREWVETADGTGRVTGQGSPLRGR